MRRYLLGIAVVAGATTARAQQPSYVVQTVQSPPQVVTAAEGEVRFTPDRATIMLGVETRAPTAAAAAADNARRQRAVMDTLRAMGIPAELMGTTDFSVYPEQVFEPPRDKAPRITGYVVRNTVRVEVRRLEQLGALIDAALAKGGNTMNGLNFFASNMVELRRRALGEAVKRAQKDAIAMAAAAGRCVGTVLELSSAESVRPVAPAPMYAMRAQAAEQTPVSPGEQSLTVSVTGRWPLMPSSLTADNAACLK